jgi:dCMP deaminase
MHRGLPVPLVELGVWTMSDVRKSWDRYFMDMVDVVATRATCDRKHIGAVIVRDRIVLCTGYNGSIRGSSHCDEVGHMMDNGHCIRTVHAEANALVQAARTGVSVNKAMMYTTSLPCWFCFKLIANAGITRVVIRSEFLNYQSKDSSTGPMFSDAGIELTVLNPSTETP